MDNLEEFKEWFKEQLITAETMEEDTELEFYKGFKAALIFVRNKINE